MLLRVARLPLKAAPKEGVAEALCIRDAAWDSAATS
jgi:hypothetical protein